MANTLTKKYNSFLVEKLQTYRIIWNPTGSDSTITIIESDPVGFQIILQRPEL